MKCNFALFEGIAELVCTTFKICFLQWWCSCFGISEWREGARAWTASDCKDHRLCWCSSGIHCELNFFFFESNFKFIDFCTLTKWLLIQVHLRFLICKSLHILKWMLHLVFFFGIIWEKNIHAGSWVVYNSTCPRNTKGDFKRRVGAISSWLLWNKWSLFCMFL